MSGVKAPLRRGKLVVTEEEQRAENLRRMEVEQVDEQGHHAKGSQVGAHQRKNAEGAPDVEVAQVDGRGLFSLLNKLEGNDVAAQDEEDVHAQTPEVGPELIFILAEMRAVPGNHQQDGHSAPAVERTNAMWLGSSHVFRDYTPSKIGPQRLPICPKHFADNYGRVANTISIVVHRLRRPARN